MDAKKIVGTVVIGLFGIAANIVTDKIQEEQLDRKIQEALDKRENEAEAQ